MDSLFTFITGILTAVLALMGFVQAHPELPPAQRDQAVAKAMNILAPSSIVTIGSVHSSDFFPAQIAGHAPLIVTFTAPKITDEWRYIVRTDDSGAVFALSPDTPTSSHTFRWPGTYTVNIIKDVRQSIYLQYNKDHDYCGHGEKGGCGLDLSTKVGSVTIVVKSNPVIGKPSIYISSPSIFSPASVLGFKNDTLTLSWSSQNAPPEAGVELSIVNQQSRKESFISPIREWLANDSDTWGVTSPPSSLGLGTGSQCVYDGTFDYWCGGFHPGTYKLIAKLYTRTSKDAAPVYLATAQSGVFTILKAISYWKQE